MTQTIVKHIIRAIVIFLIQVLILNQIEIGYGIQLMIYPILLMLLPVEINVFYLMIIAFVFGGLIDIFTNGYGLNASSLVVFAYFRPLLFKLFSPRDGYDPNQENSIFEMGTGWFFRAFGLLLIIHHLWYFVLEMFKFSEMLYILQKTGLSVALSFILCILFQYLFLRKPKKEQ